jgi:hypothetical protein
MVCYDIIVGDFGRDATIEFLRLVSKSEKDFISEILKQDERKFFDEYRRIMFTVIGDVAYFKSDALRESAAEKGYLTDSILIGVGSPMSSDFEDRVAWSILQEVYVATNRGYTRLRIAIPCNTLSSLAVSVGKRLGSKPERQRLIELYGDECFSPIELASTEISVHIVPEAVVRHVGATRSSQASTPILVLGTRDTNAMYEQLAPSYKLQVVPIEDRDYELINQAVVASIDRNPDDLLLSRDRIRQEVIEPRLSAFPDMVILEACTDFSLGLGLSSLQLFAEAMVADCYRPSNFDLATDLVH